MQRSVLHAMESEVAVLGALLIDAECAASVFDALTPEDFVDGPFRVGFRACRSLYDRGTVIDPPLLLDALRARNGMDDGRAGRLVGELLDAVPTAANVRWHIQEVRDRAIRRRLYHAATETAEDVLKSGDDATVDIVDRAERRIMDATVATSTSEPQRLGDLLWPVFRRMDDPEKESIGTGLPDLDDMLGGFAQGQVNLIAGATSMGKSGLTVQVATHNAVEKGIPTLFFSVEMTNEQNVLRCLSDLSLVDLEMLVKGSFGGDESARIQFAADRMKDAPLWFEDRCTRVAEMKSRARRAVAEHGVRLIVVDHIHDMEGEGDSRREQVAGIARGLKHIGKEMNVPVVAAAQLSRAPRERADHRPIITDLAEAGDLERIAEKIILLFRPEYYFGPTGKDGRNIEGDAEAIIAKNRMGRTGTVKLYFRKQCARFESLAREAA